MSKIKNMRSAFSCTCIGMPIKRIVDIAGVPDLIYGTFDEGMLVWQDSVWKGIFRGGTIYRKVIVFTKGGKIVQFSSENLNVSSW